jgi:hypothetical protein
MISTVLTCLGALAFLAFMVIAILLGIDVPQDL